MLASSPIWMSWTRNVHTKQHLAAISFSFVMDNIYIHLGSWTVDRMTRLMMSLNTSEGFDLLLPLISICSF